MKQIISTVLLAVLAFDGHSQNDSLTIFTNDSMFALLKPELVEISEVEFISYLKADSIIQYSNNTYCRFFTEHRLDLFDTCYEICEAFLKDTATGKNMLLPSNYDGGIIDMEFSHGCNQFIVYSSYDLPSYADYYEHRAEIYCFSFGHGKGLDDIHPAFKYFADDWSIARAIWVNDSTLALKTYYDDRIGTGQGTMYVYYNLIIPGTSGK